VRQWEVMGHAEVPGDECTTIYLAKRGSRYAIFVDGRELMATGGHGSEDALADWACDRMGDLSGARILVGGLGVGFTLAAALRRIGADGEVTVAELLPAVVDWNRSYLGQACGHPLRDTRTRVHLGDVADLVDDPPHRWCAILLDVDNGPNALTRPSNGWLYTQKGLSRARRALRPGGVLGIWSCFPDDNLTRRLEGGGFEVEMLDHTEPLRPTEDDSGTHVLWMAKRV
jgi:spermidine synthase